ncbi:MAG: lyase family protein [Patescibacteria group bacterium]
MDRDVFANLSPLDHRYYASNPELFEELSANLSENAFVHYQLEVEAALVRALARRGLCSPSIAEEVGRACAEVSPEEVYREEELTRHNVRALVNCIQRRVSTGAQPFVHLTATSVDILDTANALRLKKAAENTLLPRIAALLRVLIDLARRERETPQIGRTHGQHAVPITFGFALAQYVARLGGRMERIAAAARDLRGKMAGAVGAYNAGALFFADPEVFEAEVLAELGLSPAPVSTQIVPPEYVLDFLHALVSAHGVLANLADDLRHLQRTEIAEVAEAFAPAQVGSSTMPHKRNPWNFEHVKSLWKEFMPRMITHYLDQVSEHQRDLTNSASSRFIPELLAGLAAAVDRMEKTLGGLYVDRERMRQNLDLTREDVIAEPLYILLAYMGEPKAHETVRLLTLEAAGRGMTLRGLLEDRPERFPFLERMSPAQREILAHPEAYTGRAAAKTDAVCDHWEKRLAEMGF